MTETISAVINTKNVADSLRRTLESVSFCDEIIIMDMQSTDETLDIAAQFTDKIFEHEDVGYVEPARQAALSKASSKWILLIDADEVIPDSLRYELQEAMRNVDSDGVEESPVAYRIPRKNIIFGEWIQHAGWWPDYQVRFFRNGAVQWPDEIHGQPDISGEVHTIPPEEDFALEHYNYDSISDFITRMNRYTSIQAQGHSATERHPMQVWVDEFAQRYFLHQGWKDGEAGMAISLLQAQAELVHALKQEEKEWNSTANPELETLSDITDTLRYWIADTQLQRTSGLVRVYWMIRRKLRL